MIYIFYNSSNARLNEQSFIYLLHQLPVAIQEKILKFRKWEDKQRSLFGKMLLLTGLQSLGLTSYSLNSLKYTQFLKPYFNDTIDFNISHSGDYTLCAISKTGKVGIDIEAIQEIPLLGFESQFSGKEWNTIIRSENSLRSFYALWTQKEAFIKAIGTGLNFPLNKVDVQSNKITWEEQDWHLHEIKLDQRHVAHLSTNMLSPEIVLTRIDFE